MADNAGELQEARIRKPPEWPLEVKSGSSTATIYKIEIGGTTRHQLRWFESGEVKRRTITDESTAKTAAQEIADGLDSGEHAMLLLSAIEAEEHQAVVALC